MYLPELDSVYIKKMLQRFPNERTHRDSVQMISAHFESFIV